MLKKIMVRLIVNVLIPSVGAEVMDNSTSNLAFWPVTQEDSTVLICM